MRTALMVHVEAFEEALDSDGELELRSLQQLPFAAKVSELRTLLKDFGYTTKVPLSTTTAGIAAAVEAELEGHTADDVVIVYVLAHGQVDDHTGGLYVIGRDQQRRLDAEARAWLTRAEAGTTAFRSHLERPHVLFLLDLCFAGQALNDGWRLGELHVASKAHAICASTGRESAYNARLTDALVRVLGAAAAGRPELGLSAGDEYVPIDRIARLVAQEVDRLADEDGSDPQNIVATPISMARDLGSAPFFPAPFIPPAVVSAEPTGNAGPVRRGHHLWPFVRAAWGLPGDALELTEEGIFVGRAGELAVLSAWLSGGTAIHVVTGRSGIGKSALLGRFVCAAHPGLHGSTAGALPDADIWPVRRLAAVDLTGSSLERAVRAIARQLFGTDHDGRVPALRSALLTSSGPPPVLVLDGLDKALDPAAVVAEIIEPLAGHGAAAGGPMCRLLVGTGTGEAATGIIDRARRTGSLTDLDLAASHPIMLASLREYVVRLGRAAGRGERWGDFALGVAQAVCGDAGEPDLLGAHLAAGVHAAHALEAGEQPADPEDAVRAGLAASRDVTRVFDLELRRRARHADWLVPLFRALAWAHGDGMPLAMLRPAAAAFMPGGRVAPAELPWDDLTAALADLDRYLVVTDTPDGRAFRLRYRRLADVLRADSPAGSGLEAIYRTVGDPRLPRSWRHAPAYAREYALDHAADAGRLGELMSNAAFLTELAATVVRARVDLEGRAAGDDRVAVGLRIARASEALDPAMAADVRRRRLVVEALRSGRPGLADAIAELPGEPPLSWRPRWLAPAERPDPVPDEGENAAAVITASGLGPPVAYDLRTGGRHPWPPAAASAPVTALATVSLGERPVLLTGSAARVCMIALPSGPARDLECREQVRAVAAVAGPDGRTVVAAAVSGGAVESWYADGNRFAPLLDCGEPVRRLLLAAPAGAVLAVTVGRTVGVWDLARGRRHEKLGALVGTDAVIVSRQGACFLAVLGTDDRFRTYHLGDGALVSTVAIPRNGRHLLTVEGAEPMVAAAFGERLLAWDPFGDTAESWTAGVAAGKITATCAATLDGRPVIVGGGQDGSVRAFDPATGLPATPGFSTGAPVTLLAAAAPHADAPPAVAVRARRPVAAAPRDDAVAVAAAIGDRVTIARIGPGRPTQIVIRSTGETRRLDWLPAGPQLVLRRTTGDATVGYWDPDTGVALAGPARGGLATPEERRVPTVTTVVDGRIVTVEPTANGALLVRHDDGEPRVVTLHDGRVTALAVLPLDSELMLTGGRDGWVRLVNLRAYQEIDGFEVPGPVQDLWVFRGGPRTMRAVVHAGAEVFVYDLSNHDQGV
ncbi:hypothetical protein [Dactylosporangium sp. NPDC048998]|uniref:hypothetical protein n=1 Tax=Dactylosporangium sp. NPDC048998 TaxID=3363976 RepID=UPI0037158761